jgi:putative flippase GtrA
LAERNGLRIHEVPVDWVDDPDSRVHLTSTAIEDLRGIGRLLRRFAAGGGTLPSDALPAGALPANALPAGAHPANALPAGALLSDALPAGALLSDALPAKALPGGGRPAGAHPSDGGGAGAAAGGRRGAGAAVEPALAGQVVRFAGVGLASTALFAALFLTLAGPLGLDPVSADVLALLVSGVANTVAHRRFTFACRGRTGRRRHYSAGAMVAILPLVLTVGALVVAGLAGVDTVAGDLLVLTVVNGAAATGRFLLFRRWAFR